MTETLTKASLRQFTGSSTWYRHGLVRNVTYTDGVRYLAETGGAYWLIDEIAFAQTRPEILQTEFQFWKLIVNDNHTANLICEDGNGEMISSKEIEYTDFPLDEVALYFTDSVLLLPSEY